MKLSEFIKELQDLADKSEGDPIVMSYQYQFPGYSQVYKNNDLPEANPDNEVAVPEQQKRTQICQQCPKYSVFKIPAVNRLVGQCLECGCVVAWKTRIKSSHCPIGKW